MTVGAQWVCKVCWKLNRPRDEACWRCKAPRGTTEEAEVSAHREVLEAKAAMPEPVPDIVVALPVTIFRGYGKAWVRGGFAMFGLLALLAFSGVDDLGYLAVTGAFGAGLFMVMRGQAANPVPARPTPSPPRPAASNPPPTTSGTDDPGS